MGHGSEVKLAKANRREKREACIMMLSFPIIQKKITAKVTDWL